MVDGDVGRANQILNILGLGAGPDKCHEALGRLFDAFVVHIQSKVFGELIQNGVEDNHRPE